MVRINKTVRNTRYALLSQIVSIVISFVNRTIFIHYLSAEYLGINGLFGNILYILSLAELGVGSAITYNMYKPLAINDEVRVKKLMNFYCTVYTTIGIFVLVVGVSLVPFLDFFISKQPNIPYFKLIYVLYVINSSATYFFIYKRSIFFADQKNYVDSTNVCVQSVVQSIVQNILLIVTRNYILYYIGQILIIILFNFLISRKATKEYPYLKNNQEKLDKNEVKKIIRDVSAMMMHRIGYVLVFSTDNILISKFISLTAVGIYSNYTMILNALKGFLTQFISSVTASVGNLNAIETKEKSFDIYQKLYFGNAWIVGFCSIAFYVLINPFIELWLGPKYIFSKNIVLLICVNFYLCDPKGIRSLTNTFKDSMGLFWQDRFKPIFEAIINLVASVILLKRFGFIGVLIGTTISAITTVLWIEPLVVFKCGFKIPLLKYWGMFFKYLGITILAGLVTNNICLLLDFTKPVNFILSILLVFLVPNIIFLGLLFATEEFRYFYAIIKNNHTRGYNRG